MLVALVVGKDEAGTGMLGMVFHYMGLGIGFVFTDLAK